MAVGKDHMYSPDYDPEGLLSTVTTAAVTVCAGFPQLFHN
jgi:predicted acyltransferase